jgi:chromosome partitioning protein
LIATLNLVRDNLNPELAIEGVVLTMYDARTNLSADVAGEVRDHFGPAVFDTVIPRSVRLSEAPSFGLPIARYRPDSRGAIAYDALAEEMLARDPGRQTGPPRTRGSADGPKAPDPSLTHADSTVEPVGARA